MESLYSLIGIVVTVIAFIFAILGIILAFKIWGMCNDVKEIRHKVARLQTKPENRTIPQKEEYPMPSGIFEEAVVETAQPQATKETMTGAKFSEGQLVIVPESEKQFRVSSYNEEKGTYFSKKYNKSYKEEELMDFQEYWEIKRGHHHHHHSA